VGTVKPLICFPVVGVFIKTEPADGRIEADPGSEATGILQRLIWSANPHEGLMLGNSYWLGLDGIVDRTNAALSADKSLSKGLFVGTQRPPAVSPAPPALPLPRTLGKLEGLSPMDAWTVVDARF
jgi:hypothetical protein